MTHNSYGAVWMVRRAIRDYSTQAWVGPPMFENIKFALIGLTASVALTAVLGLLLYAAGLRF